MPTRFVATRLKEIDPPVGGMPAAGDQRGIVAFLSEGASYGRPSTSVERTEPHISLAGPIGDRAYMPKRARCFSYLD
jgi:hypothetical protein